MAITNMVKATVGIKLCTLKMLKKIFALAHLTARAVPVNARSSIVQVAKRFFCSKLFVFRRVKKFFLAKLWIAADSLNAQNPIIKWI